ncbi:hypothetical protein GCM10022289_45080 [Pedobacter jeongneungensis]|uniref:Phosphoribosyltransferase domain-containing protein n=1 Tax=Pedobacter jeongneungensis TaxID=947309 RepID=A0ABP8BQ33_9SPHI
MKSEEITVSIEFERKFTSINFDIFITKYYNASFENEVKIIVFDFGLLEWIGYEQLTFLSAWIEDLLEKNKKVSIKLQNGNDVYSKSDTFKRRQRCQSLLMQDWQLDKCFSSPIDVYKGGIPLNLKKTGVPAIPFEFIPVMGYDLATFEEEFSTLFKLRLKEFKNYSEREIRTNTELNYFENKFLNYSIIKELYSNVCQHAYSTEGENNCYISLYHNKKIEKLDNERILQRVLKDRYSERPIEERLFFNEDVETFKNDSYVEMTFLDFGDGISRTLRGKFEAQNPAFVSHKLFGNADSQNIDSLVLEYAFLLFTSKYELAEDLAVHDFIPRGLYIIKDIVRKYKGLIIARSRKGKVVFDFSGEVDTDPLNCVRFREDDFSETVADFPGTSITIVLPTRQRKNESREKIEIVKEQPRKIIFLGLLKLYTDHYKRGSEDGKINEKNFYDSFFHEICVILSELNDRREKILVCVNFAGISNELKGFYVKLTYFLSYTTLINDNVGALIFNILEKNIANAVLWPDSQMSSLGFFPHVIPCIHPDLEVSWLGISPFKLGERLTEAWKGDDSYEQNYLLHPEEINGNVLKVYAMTNHSVIKCRMPLFSEIIDRIRLHHTRMILHEVKNSGIRFDDLIDYGVDGELKHDYNVILKRDPGGRKFLTANGKYQDVFLSFIEKLYKKEYRRMIGTFFVFSFFSSPNAINRERKAVTTILTVTLSSQLLGKEVKDILDTLAQNEDDYREIRLIPLSSYYEFYKEPRFSEIRNKDQVLVVNDVISTGNLSRRIMETIKRRTDQVSIIILTIVDSRQDNEKKNYAEDNIIPLANYVVEKGDAHSIDFAHEPIWINPILNAPTTMSVGKSNIQNVLLSPSEFLDCIQDERFFKVGLFHINTVYHAYYLQTDNLFKQISGLEQPQDFELLTRMIERLQERRKEFLRTSLNHDYAKLEARLLNGIKADREQIAGKFKELEKLIADVDPGEDNIDFVFYPFLSAVSHFEHEINTILKAFKGKNGIEIYPIPRIMTPRGWRFTFPPKFLNHITSQKNILILDDGSCSGETIVQMIDTISFLKVKEITVLSVFARLEDFNREFLTRINEIKVDQHSIPLRVYFGSHFNMPVYSKSTHPYAAEFEDLESFTKPHIPDPVKNYAITRRDQINGNIQEFQNARPLIPEAISRKEMFRIRNVVGKFDSYRLYKEDDPKMSFKGRGKSSKEYIVDLISSENGFQAMIAVLVHEPRLIRSLNQVYPTIINYINERFYNIFVLRTEECPLTLKLYYFRILSFINIGILINIDVMTEIFLEMNETIKDEESIADKEEIYEAFNYHAFILYCIKHNRLLNYEDLNKESLKIRLSNFVEELAGKFLLMSEEKPVFFNLIKEFLQQFRIDSLTSSSSKLVQAMISLKNYYFDVIGKDDHPVLYSRLQEFYLEYVVEEDPDKQLKVLAEYADDLRTIRDYVNDSVLPIIEGLIPIKSLVYNFKIRQTEMTARVAMASLDRLLSADVSMKITDASERKVVFDSLTDLNNSILEPESAFTGNFKYIGFDLRNLVQNWFGKERTKKRFRAANINFNVSFAASIASLNIASHPQLFRILVKEITNNAIKYSPNSSCSLNFEIDKTDLLINYAQSSNKIMDKVGGRGISDFAHIAHIHGGQFTEKDKINYAFEFKFPISIII